MARTVVIADDDSGFRRLAGRLVAAAGYEVIGEAADGQRTIEAVRSLRPDVLLLDVQLPDMDGFAVALNLKMEATEIILVSSREADDYAAPLAAATSRGFISKRDLTGPAIADLVGPPT